MNESDAVAKVQELMVNLDTVRKYKELARSSFICLKYLLLATVIFFSIEIVYAFGGYFYGFYNIWLLSNINWINVLFFFIGTLVIAACMDRKAARYKPRDWSAQLTGGIPDALKLLSELDWEAVLHDMKYAKMGILAGVVGNISAITIMMSFLLAVGSSFLGVCVFHARLDMPIIVIISAILAVYLFRRDLDKGLRAVWGIDYLASDLRWFYSEFKGAQFEA